MAFDRAQRNRDRGIGRFEFAAARRNAIQEAGGASLLTEARNFVARLLVALALIVQIAAPVVANTSMVTAAADPLAGAWICGHDGTTPDDGSPGADACRLCDLVCHGNGFAATPPAPTVAAPTIRVVDVVRPVVAVDVAPAPLPSAFLARGPPENA